MTATTTTAALSYEDFRKNFPFETIYPKQYDVLKRICDGFNSGFKIVILEAPTGFGKSPVAMAVARTLGTSYICSATKDLQTQYVKDFPFLRAVKGMGNYSCLVKEDFIENRTYACGKCGRLDTNTGKKITITDECRHKVVEYGPCRSGHIGYVHDTKTCKLCPNRRGYNAAVNNIKFHDGCRYRTYPEDYVLAFRNTENEQIEISDLSRKEYQASLKITNKNSSDLWMHTSNFEDFEKIRSNFTPCPYYDQLNKGILSSHSIFNYANFLIFLRLKTDPLPQKELLVLDEGHSIEEQIVKQVGVSISKKILQRYIATDILENISYGDEDSIENKWVVFLENICQELMNAIPNMTSEETRVDVMNYLQRLVQVIVDIKSNSVNWIVSEIERENGKVSRVEFKPLDVSSYCKKIFDKCNRTLIMSATILDVNAFCRNVGLDLKAVKFIEVSSDFPVENRPVYQLNTAYLNYNSLQRESVQRSLAEAVDKIMDIHANDKGIIHTTSYVQVRFIERLLSRENRRRLISTDPEIPRDEIIAKHWLESNKRSVLISPSLHTGLDLKDDQSRFQIVVKIPYPSRADRWIEKKRKIDGGRWYNWQTALRLVQACGRSIRSKDDWAKTYVLDSAFDRFVRENKLPVWFREGII